jgi:hypothetical protein
MIICFILICSELSEIHGYIPTPAVGPHWDRSHDFMSNFVEVHGGHVLGCIGCETSVWKAFGVIQNNICNLNIKDLHEATNFI